MENAWGNTACAVGSRRAGSAEGVALIAGALSLVSVESIATIVHARHSAFQAESRGARRAGVRSAIFANIARGIAIFALAVACVGVIWARLHTSSSQEEVLAGAESASRIA